jgi:hypothetical protein
VLAVGAGDPGQAFGVVVLVLHGFAVGAAVADGTTKALIFKTVGFAGGGSEAGQAAGVVVAVVAALEIEPRPTIEKERLLYRVPVLPSGSFFTECLSYRVTAARSLRGY